MTLKRELTRRLVDAKERLERYEIRVASTKSEIKELTDTLKKL